MFFSICHIYLLLRAKILWPLLSTLIYKSLETCILHISELMKPLCGFEAFGDEISNTGSKINVFFLPIHGDSSLHIYSP